MTSEDAGGWRPLSVRNDPNAAAAYEALHDGVPNHLEPSLWAWMVSMLYARSMTYHGLRLQADVFQQAERELRRNFVDINQVLVDPDELRAALKHPADYLDLVDFLCAQPSALSRIPHLEAILREAGSVWKPYDTGGHWQLVRRVDETIQAAAESALRVQDAASQHLRQAWVDVYGRSPNPSSGYSRSVKAVESAAIPIVSPKDPLATLGKIINALLDKPSKWTVALGDDDKGNRVAAIALTCRMLWTGQHDRHGVADPNKQPVTQSEAEHAVHLAVGLVRMFRSGFVQ